MPWIRNSLCKGPGVGVRGGTHLQTGGTEAGPFQTHLSGPHTLLSVDGVSDLPQAEHPGQGTIQAWAPVPASLLGTGDLVQVTSLPEPRFLTPTKGLLVIAP